MEKREYNRNSFLKHIEIKSENQSCRGVSIDLSPTGLCFISDREINNSGCQLKLGSIELRGNIVYREVTNRELIPSRNNASIYRYGVRLETELDSQTLESLHFEGMKLPI